MITILKEIIVNTEEETTLFANEILNEYGAGNIFVLTGTLGAGKTFLVRQIAAKLGIKNTSSPTFTIVNEYQAQIKVYHFDFYRINNEYELYDIGIDDYFNDKQALILIEWGNMFEEILPHDRYEIKIEILPDFKRKFTLLKYE